MDLIEITDTVLRGFSCVCGVAVSEHDVISTLGLDSLDLVDLSIYFDEIFNISVDLRSEIKNFRTIEDVIQFIYKTK